MPVLSYGSIRSSNVLAVPLLTSLSDGYSLQTPRGIPHGRHKCAERDHARGRARRVEQAQCEYLYRPGKAHGRRAAEALADWIALHNRNLETIYITHAHFDHFYGLSILLDRFPGARAIATPQTLSAMQMSFTPTVERLARRLFPGQVATKLVAPEPYEHDTFTLEGHELRIIRQGRTDSPDSTSLYVPSIGLIVAGDVVYNQCRMYVGDTTPESRKNWIADLDRLAALNPTIVVAGHKKPGAPDSPSAIQDTKRYLEDFDRVQKTAASDQELFDQMTALYPDWVANQSWLMFGFPGV
jgi:glyoxylase-like metal-dependent hydrolase (beta-lactamase superfamily II)